MVGTVTCFLTGFHTNPVVDTCFLTGFHTNPVVDTCFLTGFHTNPDNYLLVGLLLWQVLTHQSRCLYAAGFLGQEVNPGSRTRLPLPGPGGLREALRSPPPWDPQVSASQKGPVPASHKWWPRTKSAHSSNTGNLFSFPRIRIQFTLQYTDPEFSK